MGRETFRRATLPALLVFGLVAACSGTGSDAGLVAEGLDPETVARGERLYVQYCAVCHGPDLSGAPNWMTPNPDGSYPPPPHDSSGHTWHHSDAHLLGIIRDGSPFPQSRMPAFGQVLTDDDIMAIIEFFKANWGPEEREFQHSITERDTD